MRVFFIVVGDRMNSNSRERVWKYLPMLEQRGIAHEVHVAGDVRPGVLGRLDYWRTLLGRLAKSDVILIHRVPLSASERAAIRALGPPVIFDLDDAIWYAIDPTPGGAPVAGARDDDLRGTLEMSVLVRAGNEELRTKAREVCNTVSLAPTCVDLAPESEPSGPITVGWIGHSGNFRYFDECGAALQGMRVKVVADCPPPIPAEYKPWRLEDESDDVRSFHIGIMPLADTPWARAKCGYKLLLYMAHGRPVVASPVGVNRDFVKPDRGFLASSVTEWRDALRALDDPALRRRLGAAGRAFVSANYSRERGFNDLLRDLQSVAR